MLWHALSNVPAILALLAPGRRTTSLFSCLKYPRTESDTAKTWQILVFIWCSSMFIINSMNVHQWFIRFHQRKPWVPTWDWVLDTWSLRIQRIPWLHPSMDPRHISLSTEQHQDTLRNLRVCKYIQRCLIKMIIWSSNQICVLLIFTLSFLAAPSQVVHVHLYTNGISSNSHSPMRH